MTEMEKQEVSNRRKVTGNEQDGEIKPEARRKSDRLQGGFVSKLNVQDVGWWEGGGIPAGIIMGCCIESSNVC
jgi:hypothetical protein